MDWNELTGLFRPGRGAMPPKLAGRETELAALAAMYHDINERNRAPTGDAVMYGPRGNGKTVLLDAFEKQHVKKDADIITLTPDAIRTDTDLAALLLYDNSQFAQFLEAIRSRAGADLGLGFATVKWDTLDLAERDNYKRRHLVDLLVERCRNRPLVVTLDEAHTLDKDVGRGLLNASQLAQRRGARFLLVMAGTPSLPARLRKMNATFWNRAKKLGIGRLSHAATREALVVPLAGVKPAGIGFEPEALATVVAESQQYPYFIQIWGEALCQALTARQSTRINLSIVDAARPRFTSQRNAYYKDRYEEIKEQELLKAARAVAGLFRHTDTLDDEEAEAQLVEALALETAAARAVIGQLSDLGFIWQQADSTCYEPGIPSLMDYVQTKGRELARERENQPPPKPAGPSLPTP